MDLSSKIKTFKRTFFVSFIIFLTLDPTANAESVCQSYLSGENASVPAPQTSARDQIYSILESNAYSVLTEIETLSIALENPRFDINPAGQKKMYQLINELNDLWEHVAEVLENLEQLKSQLGNTEANLLPQFSSIKNELSGAKNNLSSQRDYALRLILRYSSTKSMTFEDVIDNPKMVFADYGYTLKTQSNQDLVIFFSSSIVNDLFVVEKIVQNRVVSRALKDAQKGLFGAHYEGAGIKRRVSDSELIEIRSVGKDANFRLYGYIHNKNEIHIVSYTTSSNHGSVQLQQRINEGIYHSRTNRDH